VSRGAPFTARYDSDGACGHPIFEGDDAGYVDDEPVCGDCWDEAEDGEVAPHGEPLDTWGGW
jgi:hypothetical protein